ncbi:MAG: hypothetical protein ACI4TM_06360 [Candidatus Cryptobacteroides sp.]
MIYELEHRAAICIECGDAIKYGGRVDRKFCCSACKNRYHNRNARRAKRIRTKTINVLDNNYSILNNMVRNGVKEATVSDMRQLGFNFSFSTSYSKIRRHDVFRCYDISYSVVADRVVAIDRMSRQILTMDGI